MENARCSSSCSFMSQLMMVDFPVPLGAENMISLPLIFLFTSYSALSTCSLICSSSSFIFTTIFCISAWFDFEPVVLISRPIS